MSKISNVDEIIDFINANGISDDDWQRMYDAAVKFDDNQEEQDKHKALLDDIRELEKLYATDKSFKLWCKYILEIVKYQEYVDDAERNSPFAVEDKYPDSYHENYYIPVMCPKDWVEGGNPFLRTDYRYTEIYVRSDLIDLISGVNDNRKAFVAFWKGKFQTKILPECIESDKHSKEVAQIRLFKKSTDKDYYRITSLRFDYTR